MKATIQSVLVGLALISLAAPVWAQEPVADPAASAPVAVAAESAPSEALGLNLDVGLATMYVFRGLNVFQKDGQDNQHMLLAPGVTWSVFDTGLSIGYWGAYQITGDNKDMVVDAGLGMEQDLLLVYSRDLGDNLGLSLGLAYYFYPAADEKLMGASVPSYLEPSAGIGYSGVVDAGIAAVYFYGIQDQPAIRGISYLYLNPSVGKTLNVTDTVGLAVGLSYGFKLYKEGNTDAANIHDVTVKVGLPVRVSGAFYFEPSANAAWTDLPEINPADELAYWGGLNVGTDL